MSTIVEVPFGDDAMQRRGWQASLCARWGFVFGIAWTGRFDLFACNDVRFTVTLHLGPFIFDFYALDRSKYHDEDDS